MTSSLTHLSRPALFILLSLADLALTCWLLGRGNGHAYEANPIARWWLARYGWPGLAAFKVAAVLVVLGLVAIIARSRPTAARGVLRLGCVALTGVVLYSAALCRDALAVPGDELARTMQKRAELDRRLAVVRQQLALRRELVEAVTTGRCPLGEAVERLTGHADAWGGITLKGLACRYPGRSAQELLAISLCSRALADVGADGAAGALLRRRLEQEFARTYGTALPTDLQRWPVPLDAGPGASPSSGPPNHRSAEPPHGRTAL
jgi:hypothetical protein